MQSSNPSFASDAGDANPAPRRRIRIRRPVGENSGAGDARKPRRDRPANKSGKAGTPKKHRNSHAREVALQALYQMQVVRSALNEVLEFGWLNEPMDAATDEHARYLIAEGSIRAARIDRMIRRLSHKEMGQLSNIVLCILRIGIVELDRAALPADVILDDLCNLTRTYDGEESVGFVNGLLDAYIREMELEREELESRGPGAANDPPENDAGASSEDAAESD